VPDSKSLLTRARTLVPLLALAALLALGFAVHRDYGVTSDEVGLRTYGRMVYDFYKSGDRSYESFSNLRYYGPLVCLLVELAERAVSPAPENIYRVRHVATYLIYVAGVAAFYLLAARQMKSRGWGLFAATLFVASPRVFAHALVNVKDMPFMMLLTAGVLALVRYLDDRRWTTWLWLTLAAALLIDVRILGVLLVGMTGLALAADEAFAERRQPWRRVVAPVALLLVLAAPVVVALWPYLWDDPLGRFRETFQVFSRFRGGPRHTLYMGELIQPKRGPWHFLPVWFLITTPISYLVLFLVGLHRLFPGNVARLFRERHVERHYFLFGFWFFFPPAWIILRKAILYDDWRQAQFVYPAFILFVAAGAQALVRVLRARAGVAGGRVAWGGLALMVLTIALRMVELHPYQLVYFNAFVGGLPGAKGRYETDYWGFSYKEALEYLMRRDGVIKVKACFGPAPDNAILFADRQRLRFVELNEAEFLMCSRREATDAWLPGYKTVYAVSREGVPLTRVKRLRTHAGPGLVGEDAGRFLREDLDENTPDVQ
jgi:hypothetical protein